MKKILRTKKKKKRFQRKQKIPSMDGSSVMKRCKAMTAFLRTRALLWSKSLITKPSTKKEKGEKMTETTQGKRVKCYGCHNHIHIDHFAGIAKARNGRTVYVCDALPCLLKLAGIMEDKKND